MTDALMGHGQHGAEVLAGLMQSVFDPLVESVFDYGGKIVGFAGDGVMALYPVQEDERSTALQALTSACVIQDRLKAHPSRQTIYGKFSVSAKIGLAIGSVSWGVLRSSDEKQASYYFRGSAVDDCAELEHHARAGDILLTQAIRQLLRADIEVGTCDTFCRFERFLGELPRPSKITLPPVDLSISRRFMPEEVIARNMRGEFRQIVNLFMRFPDLAEVQLRDLMGKVFELRDKYGGLLNRIDFGDKGCNLLMLWGAPVAYENDISRALNFLLDLKAQVDFPITSGVTYYIAHAGYLGSGMCEDYTCYGWGINLASRFMMSAASGETWVDDRIARRVSRRFEIEFLGNQLFKGFAAEQKVHRLRGRKQTLEPVYQGELAGRGDELEQLSAFIKPLWQNKFAGLLLVSGDAGIGKGRLIYEFRSSRMFDGKTILWAICQSDQILRQSFNPFRNWLLKYAGISPLQSLEERKRAFDTKLDELIASVAERDLAHELDRTRSILGGLLDLHWNDSLYEQLDPEGRYNNTFLALIALFKAESLRQPVVIFLEDLQFTDDDSRDFLGRLKRVILSSGNEYPIAIIVTTRPSGVSLEPDLTNARIELRGLSRSAIMRLSETMLGGPAAPTLVTMLLKRSEGNPYFVEQIIRYLQEESFLETSTQGWALVKRLQDDFLPGDIRALLVARLDQLAREVKECIQTAAVLGREFEILILCEMLHEDPNVPAYVAEAEKAAIWAPLHEMRYIFSHGLLRDAAYEMQMQSRRRQLHALAVEALERLYANDLKAHYAELAYHAGQAELRLQAQKYYLLAGKSSAEGYQNRQAIDYYTHALAFTPRDDFHKQFDILFERGGVFSRIGERTSQLKDLESLKKLALHLGNDQLLAKAKMLRAQYCFTTGDYPGTMQLAEEVVAKAQQLGDIDTALGVYPVLAHALFRSGRLDEAMKCALDGLELARQSGRRVEEGKALSSIGLIALETKEPGLAQNYLEEAVAIARETKDRTLESRAIANLANAAAYIQRDYVAARAYFEQANALNQELGDRYAQGIALGNIGWTCGLLGDYATAQKYHQQALLIAREVGNYYHETYTLMNLSSVAEARQEAQEAMKYALQANELCKEKGDKQSEAWSYLYLGYAYLLDDQLDEASTAFEEALKLRRERKQTSLATEPTAGLIQVALRMNDISSAGLWMEDILGYLSEGGTLDGTEEPLRVYLACFDVLDKTADPRAPAVLQVAVQLLEEQASKISDEKSRRMYVENVPWRRAIEQAGLARKEKI